MVEVRGIPHLAKNERDMGHPSSDVDSNSGLRVFPKAPHSHGDSSTKERDGRDQPESLLRVMKLRPLEFRSEKRRGDVFASVRIIATQADLQGARHRALRLAGIRALVLSAVTPPNAQG